MTKAKSPKSVETESTTPIVEVDPSIAELQAEIAALKALLAPPTVATAPEALVDPKTTASELGKALVEAIELTRPMQKKNILNRKKGGPFNPKDGSVKPKLRRDHYQHAVPISNSTVTPDEVNLLNKIKPGAYCGGLVKVILRKDRGIDIDYPSKTTSQRLQLVNQFGIVNFKALLERIVEEQAQPVKFIPLEDQDSE